MTIKRTPAPRVTVQLSATLAAPAQHGATVDLAVAADSVDLAADARTLTGTITSYNTVSTSQHVVIHDGALTPRQPLNRVKMLRDHRQDDPVGYMLSLDAAGKEATFYIPEGENGDRAIAEAAAGLRDGLSIGFHSTEYGFDDDYNFHVYAAELYEVSLCAIPDMQDAVVSNVAALSLALNKETPTMDREALKRALSAGTISQATYDAEVAALDALDRNLAAAGGQPTAPASTVATPAGQAAAAEQQTALAAGPDHQAPAPAAHVQINERALSLSEVTRRVALAAQNGRPQDIALALSDVIPSADAGEAFIKRKDWIGELFTARQVGRPWIDSFGVPGQLTSMTRKGYRIVERPTVGKYDGDKKAIPSEGKLRTEPAEFGVQRWAGGWDIDRAFVDFGDQEYINAFWNAAIEEYQVASDMDIAAQVIAAAVKNTSASTSVLGAILSLARSVRGIKGSQLNRIKMSGDLFDEYAMLTKDEVPFWLANSSGGLNLLEGTVDLAQLVITTEPELPDQTIVGYDYRGAAVKEKSPIQVQAYDIAKGGIDLGFYSYGAFELYDPRLFHARTVTPATADAGTGA